MYRILFVEDDSVITYIVKKYKLWEYSEFQIAQTAENGKEALEYLDSDSFDLVITDIRMPLIDGLECIRRMRARGDKTLVLLASTYTDFKYAKEGIRLGALDFIEKPFTEEKLAEGLALAHKSLMEQISTHENSLDLYSCVRKKRMEEIAERLFLMDEEAGEELLSISRELKQTYEKEPSKAVLLLNLIMQDIWKQMIQKYEWISFLEEPGLEITQEAYDSDFHKSLTEITAIIDKYSLYKQDNQVNKICGILVANRSNPAVTDILEEELGLTKDYIGRLFHAKVGITISQYITMLKMEYAKSQLAKTNAKVYEISERLGYQTTDYFTRLFKGYTGYTPAQYRKIL